MNPIRRPDRRGFLKGGLSLGALSLLAGCDLTDNEPAQRLLWNMSYWNYRVQGWLFNPNRLAPTFPESAVARVDRVGEGHAMLGRRREAKLRSLRICVFRVLDQLRKDRELVIAIAPDLGAPRLDKPKCDQIPHLGLHGPTLVGRGG